MGQKYVYNPLTCEYDIIDEGAPGPVGPRGPVGASGADGADGADGAGVAPGGAPGQVLAKVSEDDFDTEWVDQSGGGGGIPTLQEVVDASPVDEVNLLNHGGGYYLLFGDPGSEQAQVGRSGITGSNPQIGNNGASFLLDSTGLFFSGDNGAEASLQGAGTLALTRSGWPNEATVYITPTESSGISSLLTPPTTGEETIATREWVTRSGATGSRPSSPSAGEMYLDTTVGKPIWYDGSQWIDANGTGV